MLVKFNIKMLYVNTFVKVDTEIEEDCRQTISYLKGYSYLRLYCKKQSNQKLTANTVSTLQQQHKLYLHDYNYVVTVLQKL